jgi:Tfp pilus assembly protein PilO
MKTRLAALSQNQQIALVCAGLLLVAVIGYFALISPKRSTAGDLKDQTASVQAQIERNRSTGFAKALPAVRSASVFSLTKAMPDSVEMANVILELNQLAVDSGITFDEITPQGATADIAFEDQPITVTFTGNFYNLSDFLLRLRNLVRVDNGKLLARGRMFAVSNVSFAEADQKFPYLTATLTVDAFVPAAPQPAAPETSTSTETTTETTTTTSSGQTASPTPASTGGQS